MRVLFLIVFCLIMAGPLHGQSSQNAESDCVRSLCLDVLAWAQIQQERRSLTGFDPSTATQIEQAEDEKYAIDGFIETIDTSQFYNCPSRLSQIAGKTILYAKQLRSAYVKAIEIMRRVDAEKYIPKQELDQVDREMTRSLASWKSIMPLFEAELELCSIHE